MRYRLKSTLFAFGLCALTLVVIWSGLKTNAEGSREVTWIKIPAGSFQMGSQSGMPNEQPLHKVSVKAFLMSETEVTMRQYRQCVDAGRCTEPDRGGYKDACVWGKDHAEDHPINCVDWVQARTFAIWAGGDLPTEAQWEYAARGGEDHPYAGASEVDQVAWYLGNREEHIGSRRVKLKKSNGYNLYDMSGNVWEWILDEAHADYQGAPSEAELPWGELRPCEAPCEVELANRMGLIRGGAWHYAERDVRIKRRDYSNSNIRHSCFGFRIAKAQP